MAIQPDQSNSQRGAFGEDLACQALEAHGYSIIERNWRCPAGEIDIVSKDGDVWVFVEVKLRQGEAYGTPEEAVTRTKQERLLQSGLMYLAEHNTGDVDWRIDVVAIVLSNKARVQRLDLYRNAVVARDD